MKILHIDETFHPSYGYQTNPLAKFQSRQGNEIFILTVTKEFLYPIYQEFGDDGKNLDKEDALYESQTGVTIIRVPVKRYLFGRAVFDKRIYQEIDRIHPDVIFVHCVETLMAIRMLMKKKKYPMVFDSHMLAMASKNRMAKVYEMGYRALITPRIKKNHYIVIRTQDDDYVNTHLGIPKEQTPFISFGTDTVLFQPDAEQRRVFRQEHGIDDDAFVIVYTGKLTEAKGGILLAEAFQKPFDCSKEVVFVVVGNAVGEYGSRVESLLNKAAVRVIRFPTQKYPDLARFYQAADLSVFAKQCSMSFYDAQACGLPVVSEDNNINVERCSHENGLNFKAGDVEDFRHKLQLCMNMPAQEYQKMRKKAYQLIKEQYDYENIAKQYTELLTQEVERWNQKRSNGQ